MNIQEEIDQAWEDLRENGDIRPPPMDFVEGFLAGMKASAKAQKTFILSRMHPVEVLVKIDKWVKIRDADNTIGWIESAALGNTRAVQISANTAEIRAMPNPNATIVFEAQRAVVLETTGPVVNGWLPVRHRDGQTGYVSKSQVWGE